MKKAKKYLGLAEKSWGLRRYKLLDDNDCQLIYQP